MGTVLVFCMTLSVHGMVISTILKWNIQVIKNNQAINVGVLMLTQIAFRRHF